MMSVPIALVTGVIGGIGSAIASRLSQDGMKVIITDLPGKTLQKISSDLGLPSISSDLGNSNSVKELHANLVREYGNVNVLVNAAGGVCNQKGTSLEKIIPSDWEDIFKANLNSALFLSQSVVPSMKKKGWGRIVTISSGAGLRPSLTGIHAYTAAKHSLVGLTKQLSLELGRFGITVNSVAPGFILSNPSTLSQWEAYGAKGQKQLIEKIHMRRLGKPEDIASAVSFLSSEEANWITGQILSVDGGIS